MKNSLKVAAFVVLIVVFIAGFASLIPQVGSPAPQQLEITSDLSGQELADVGEEIFSGAEAGCLACHAIGRPGLRAPDLAGVGARAAEREPGLTAEEYLHEAITQPCAYVVEGFDCIMPQTLMQTLGPGKVTALIAFLQSQGGEITVSLSAEDAQASPPPPGGGVGVAGTTAEEIIASLGCAGCHTLEAVGAAGVVGPNLSAIGGRLTADEIRTAILTPDDTISEECPNGPCPEGVMPKDFGSRLTGVQLETLVTFLSSLK